MMIDLIGDIPMLGLGGKKVLVIGGTGGVGMVVIAKVWCGPATGLPAEVKVLGPICPSDTSTIRFSCGLRLAPAPGKAWGNLVLDCSIVTPTGSCCSAAAR